jgi:hypothetical protein
MPIAISMFLRFVMVLDSASLEFSNKSEINVKILKVMHVIISRK